MDYHRLLTTAGAKRIMIVGVEPTEPGKVDSRAFDPVARQAENALLPGLAHRAHAIYVRPLAATTGLTEDGVHLNPGGARAWQAAIGAACPKQL